jgi:hypothetical protein
MTMIAITTSNSIKVNPGKDREAQVGKASYAVVAKLLFSACSQSTACSNS